MKIKYNFLFVTNINLKDYICLCESISFLREKVLQVPFYSEIQGNCRIGKN